MGWVLNPKKGKQRETQHIKVPKGWQSVCKPFLVEKDLRTLGKRRGSEGTRESEPGPHSVCEEGCRGEEVLPPRVLGLRNRNLIRGRTRNSGKVLLGSLLQQGWARTSNRFPCSPRRGKLVPYMGVRVGVYPGVGPKGWLRFAHPFVVLCAGGMPSTLLLLPTSCFCSWLFRSGSWSFCIFWPEFAPTGHAQQLFLVPYSFFVFFSSRRLLSRCKHCSTVAKGPRSQASLRGISSGPTELGTFNGIDTEVDLRFFIQRRTP